jgi:hypothetical protein
MHTVVPPAAQVIAMSTEHDYTPGSAQYAWLEAELKAAAMRRSTFPWLFLIGHRPMYSSDTSEWSDHSPGAEFQRLVEPLMLAYKVDLYLCGHMHMYEVRTSSWFAWSPGMLAQQGAVVCCRLPVNCGGCFALFLGSACMRLPTAP